MDEASVTRDIGFCTVSTASHLAFCRVLAESVSRTHPGRRLTVLLIDDSERVHVSANELFDVVSPDQVDLDPAEFRRMAAVYEAIELACALKPWVIRRQLDAGFACAVYLDGDTQVFGSLTDLVAAAKSQGVALVPHTYELLDRDGLEPADVNFLRFGSFNGGCLAVADSAQGRRFLAWWSLRLARGAIYSDEEGLYLDQRWLDLVPPIFDAAIVRDPGLDVAYWNRAAALEWKDGHYLVGSAPLRLFHYSGFDPRDPTLLSTLNRANPRATTAANPALARLTSEYASRLMEQGFEDLAGREYRFARTLTGFPLDRRIRRLYRSELLAGERGEGQLPPDPFTEAGAGVFIDWLNEVPEGARVSRYLGAVYGDRSDVRGRFPVLAGTDRELFLAWAREFGGVDAHIPAELIPPPPEVEPDRAAVGNEFPAGGLGRLRERIRKGLAGLSRG